MTQLEELELAVKENRQPMCVACNQPLDAVSQYEPSYHYWTWDAESKGFVKDHDYGDCDRPYHPACGIGDWDLIDGGSMSDKLGLTY